MPRISIPLPVTCDYDTYSARRTGLTNMRHITHQGGAVEVIPSPGLVTGATVAAAAARHITSAANHAVVVAGANAYKYNGTTLTSIGAIDAGTTSISALSVDTGTHLVIVDPYINTCCGIALPALAAVTTITPPGGISFAAVAYQDGYTIYAREGSDEFYISALDDPTTIGALDFSTADALPGNIVGIISDHRELVIFKELSIEFWINTGNASFPFERSQPGVAELGCLSARTIAKSGNVIYFLGSDNRVHRLRGYQPEPVSNDYIASQVYSSMGGSVYDSGRRQYYHIGLTAQMSLHMDLETGAWHKRVSSDYDYYVGFVSLTLSGGSRQTYALVKDGTSALVCNYASYARSDTSSSSARIVQFTLPDTVRGMILKEIAIRADINSGAPTLTIGAAIVSMSATRAGRYHAWRRLGRRGNELVAIVLPADTDSLSEIVIDFEPLE